ncbi:hypothetical protein ASF32_14595 [Methylobacterium sp. Leaf91]|nr:hypothetical protein ASF32_14595 [Methylobacterium sp. Leaf91]
MSRGPKQSPLAVANTFIARFGGQGTITHMKVQKLCYFAHGWWLAFDPEPFLTERPQVWKFGPVFGSLYAALSHHGSRAITQPEKVQFNEPPPQIDNPAYLDLIDWVWNRYGQHSGLTLSDMTHAPGTPWRNVAERCNFQVPKHYELPDEDVKKFFEAEAKALQPV